MPFVKLVLGFFYSLLDFAGKKGKKKKAYSISERGSKKIIAVKVLLQQKE